VLVRHLAEHPEIVESLHLAEDKLKQLKREFEAVLQR